MSLSCEGIVKYYGGLPVLQDCGLTVSPGSCVVIRGRSGGGKSTLLRILALLENANAGSVKHGEEVIEQPRPNSNYPLGAFPFLTLVFQQLFLWPNMSIQENVSLVVYGERRRPFAREHLELFEDMKIADLITKKPHECSLGQRQRVAIARALMTKTKYLLLDEPTSALDLKNRAVAAELLSASKADGRGLLIVSHDERDFARLQDEAYDLQDGRLQAI